MLGIRGSGPRIPPQSGSSIGRSADQFHNSHGPSPGRDPGAIDQNGNFSAGLTASIASRNSC